MSDNKSNILDRLKDFNNKLFKFWKCNNESFLSCGRLNLSQMIELKHNVHDVNNIITLLVTYLFIKELNDQYKFANTLNINDIENKPNANGYDFIYNTGKRLIVAEVKCNLPCGENNTYGAKQKEGIIKDLKGLVDKTSKSKSDNQITDAQFNSAYKFLVLIEGNELAMQQVLGDINKYDPLDPPKRMKQELRELADFLKDNKKNLNKMSIVEFKKNKPLSPSEVNVMYIELKDNLISELLDEKNNKCNISAQL